MTPTDEYWQERLNALEVETGILEEKLEEAKLRIFELECELRATQVLLDETQKQRDAYREEVHNRVG